MKITKEKAQEALKDLQETWDIMFKGRKPKRSSTEWERQREKVNEKMRNLEPFVREAAQRITITRSPGRPKLFGLVERTMLFLFVVLVGKSNRYCEALLEFFQPVLKNLLPIRRNRVPIRKNSLPIQRKMASCRFRR